MDLKDFKNRRSSKGYFSLIFNGPSKGNPRESGELVVTFNPMKKYIENMLGDWGVFLKIRPIP